MEPSTKQVLFFVAVLAATSLISGSFQAKADVSCRPAAQHSGVSSVDEIGGLKSYVSGQSKSKRAVILASDVFGFSVPNLRKIADKVAAAGFFVVVPDFFNGDPYVPGNPQRPVQVWKSQHNPNQTLEHVAPVVKALKNKGISAIGAAGFCYGAKVTMELAKTGLIKAAVFLHPTDIAVDDFKQVKVPVAVLGGQNDRTASPAVLKKYEEILSAKPGIDTFVKVFPGVGHGWTTRYNATDKHAVKSADEARQDMLNWFIKHVKPY